MISINLIRSYRDVVAVSDVDLLGKRFEEPLEDDGQGRVRQIDVKENFYRGEQVSEERAVELMKRYAREDVTFNIVGESSVKAAIEAGIIEKENVSTIQTIPFALVLL